MTTTHITRRMVVGLTTALLISTAALADTAPQVKFQTSLGDFTVEVYPDKAPKTVENFLQYVKDKFYNGTIFHRVIGNFMVQGGGFTPDMNQKATREPIVLEAKNGLKNDRGTIAMARTSNPNSATAQFFVNVVDNNGLNAPSPDGFGYAVFGKVIAGMDTIDKIRAVPTGRQDVPATPILINSATLVK
jgi:peptidyl-prolyl cis-trans isomerase A (cyclophilin A)